MFEGIYLNKGDHHITLKYETPGLKIGAVVSLFSLIILFIISKKEEISVIKKSFYLPKRKVNGAFSIKRGNGMYEIKK